MARREGLRRPCPASAAYPASAVGRPVPCPEPRAYRDQPCPCREVAPCREPSRAGHPCRACPAAFGAFLEAHPAACPEDRPFPEDRPAASLAGRLEASPEGHPEVLGAPPASVAAAGAFLEDRPCLAVSSERRPEDHPCHLAACLEDRLEAVPFQEAFLAAFPEAFPEDQPCPAASPGDRPARPYPAAYREGHPCQEDRPYQEAPCQAASPEDHPFPGDHPSPEAVPFQEASRAGHPVPSLDHPEAPFLGGRPCPDHHP